MSFLEDLRQARESPVSVYQQFLLEYPKSRNNIHAFFEGHDDSSFYYGLLSRFIANPSIIHTYKCGSKKGVYETYEKVMRSVKSQSIVLFFVDKDFSDILGESYPTAKNIFVTDYYSIENHLVSEAMLHRVWEDFFSFTNVRIDFEKIRTKFQGELKRFYEFILPLTAWIIFVKRNGQQPNLNNLKLSKACFFNDELSLSTIEMEKLIEVAEQMCGVKTPPGFTTAISSLITELSILEPKKYIRGKFELWFFVEFIKRLAETLKKRVLEGGESVKVRTQIHEENAIEVLGPRVPIPPGRPVYSQENSQYRSPLWGLVEE